MKKKKLSLESLLLTEADILKFDQNLKFNVVQKLPMLFQKFMKELKVDKYDEAIKTLSTIAATAQEAQNQLQTAIQNNPQAKQPGVQRPDNTISNKEI